MNIAKIMIPKISTAYLLENNTVRQGLEKFNRYGYTAVPVLDENGIYAGTVTEGDFLRHIMEIKSVEMKDHESYLIKDIIRKDFCPSLLIAAEQEDVIVAVSNQNFVPIVDGRGVFCGIITRKGVIESLANELEK
ncbi:MAG: CBS domain-containing protein [Oscillospiraceae bacterium]|nr:CBS domain-containing protein [Oscillospiraceae bacterium]MBR3962338.1 CBS domain-containing protein [Oscillospiraceae bacterium]